MIAVHQKTESGRALLKYQSPPYLKGYTYAGRRAYAARDANRLLAIRIETNHACNLRCRYCYAESRDGLKAMVPFDTLKRVIRQARDLGAESVVVIGGGEPTLYPQFNELIAFIDTLAMVPVVFSNCIRIDEDTAKRLYDHNASVMGKLDSLNSTLQDFLAGLDGAAFKIRKGLDNLLAAGFADTRGSALRLGVSFVSNRMNLAEIEDIWHYCRTRNIFPNMEVLTPTGRANESLAGCFLDSDDVQAYKQKVREIDNHWYGRDWLPHTPLAASGCLQHLYSLYITINGDVRPCAPTKFDENPALKVNGVYPYNINRTDLLTIFQSPLFHYVRHIDRHLEGKCGGCEHHDQCIGCRGYSYSVGTNAGQGPLKALRSECLQCMK